jgi:DSF synthase
MNAPVDFKAIEGMLQPRYEQLETRFDPDLAIAWTYMNPSGTPCFNTGLLKDLRSHDHALEMSGGYVPFEGTMCRASYHVLASQTRGIYNLGGDLSSFAQFILAHDRNGLMDYATLCIDDIYARICNYNSPLITVSLVQGDALGGGFETAISSNVVIAERNAKMGFPEILFNLFPGMGAYSLLGRRVGAKRAEEMILSGRIYSAPELHALGVVDILAEPGEGEAAVYEYVRGNERRYNGAQAVFRCRQQFQPITYDELMNITKIWVEAALRLDERDLKLMNRLVRAQRKRVQGEPAQFAEPARFVYEEQLVSA